MAEQKEVLIRYNIDDIFACQQDNCVMIRELEKYCSDNYKNTKSILSEFIKPMDDIVQSHSRGNNPNDSIMKGMIRDNLNKISPNNYDLILKELYGLKY